MKQTLTYNMSSALLPVHFFLRMSKDEITTRMACTEDLNLEACIVYCEMYTHFYKAYKDQY